MGERLAAAQAADQAPAPANEVWELERPPTHVPLWLPAALGILLLLAGAWTSPYDALEYQCYALGFWRGSAFALAPPSICSTWLAQSSVLPFHLLPQEYGPLALLAFSLPALGPHDWYPWLFAAEMLPVAAGIAALLARYGRPGAVHAWLFFLMLGSAVTALGRMDILPAACVLLALIQLREGRHVPAYIALAMGTLLKFYPVALLPLLLIETWRARGSRGAWRGPAWFVSLVLGVESAVALLDPGAVLAPLQFMGARCVEVESLPATLSSIWTLISGGHVSVTFAYHAVCQQSPAIGRLSALCALAAIAGIVYVVALRWRGRVGLGLAAILILWLTMLGSKVFSPQYLLWASPLVAWEYGLRGRPFLAWSAVCAATSLVFPLSYYGAVLTALHASSGAVIPWTVGLRNALLVALVVGALRTVSRSGGQGVASHASAAGTPTAWLRRPIRRARR